MPVCQAGPLRQRDAVGVPVGEDMRLLGPHGILQTVATAPQIYQQLNNNISLVYPSRTDLPSCGFGSLPSTQRIQACPNDEVLRACLMSPIHRYGQHTSAMCATQQPKFSTPQVCNPARKSRAQARNPADDSSARKNSRRHGCACR